MLVLTCPKAISIEKIKDITSKIFILAKGMLTNEILLVSLQFSLLYSFLALNC